MQEEQKPLDDRQLGIQYRRARELRGISLQDAADRLDLTVRQLADLEAGDLTKWGTMIDKAYCLYQLSREFLRSEQTEFPPDDLGSLLWKELEPDQPDLDMKLAIWITLMICRSAHLFQAMLDESPEFSLESILDSKAPKTDFGHPETAGLNAARNFQAQTDSLCIPKCSRNTESGLPPQSFPANCMESPSITTTSAEWY